MMQSWRLPFQGGDSVMTKASSPGPVLPGSARPSRIRKATRRGYSWAVTSLSATRAEC